MVQPLNVIERQAGPDADEASAGVAVATSRINRDVVERRPTDLSIDDLDVFAGEAWSSAARDALAEGHAIAGIYDGRLILKHPDGRIEDRGPVSASRER